MPPLKDPTYHVEWIRDLPTQPGPDDSIVLAVVQKGGGRSAIRYTLYSHYLEMRRANRTAPSVSDMAFLTEGLGVLITKSAGQLTHFEIGVTKMTDKGAGQRMEFGPNAFEPGTNKAKS